MCIRDSIGIAWILIEYTDSNVPWLDSFTTALSIVGSWMLPRKYVDQWFASVSYTHLDVYKRQVLSQGTQYIKPTDHYTAAHLTAV